MTSTLNQVADKLTLSCSQVWGGNRATSTALSLPGLDTWVGSVPHREAPAGGDVHFVSSCGTGRITRLVLADVAGHGTHAAQVAGMLRGLMQRFLNHVEPVGLANAMNRALMGSDQRDQRFATAVIMTFFSPNGSLSVCNAGHPAPALYRREANAWQHVEQPDTKGQVVNLPLGVLEETGYMGRECKLNPGDVVVAYTDGLTEARDDAGNELTTAGLLDALRRLTDDHGPELTDEPQRLGDALLQSLRDRGFTLDDDITLVVSRCTERSAGSSLGDRVKGIGRSFRLMLTPGEPTPWPELTRQTVSPSALPLPGGKS